MLCGSGRASAHCRTRGASSSSPLLRGAAQRRAACFVSTATAPHASSCHDRRSPRQRRQLPPVLPPCAHPYPTCAACHSFAREHTRALRAHVRHFSFFAFTSSPLCRKSLYDSRFGVKVFSKILHRGEASAPHPPSDCNRPPNDRSTRTHPGREPQKAPCKMPKGGGNCIIVPDRGGEGVGEGISRKAFTPYGLNISVLTHGG